MTTSIIMPSSEADKQKIKNAMKEISGSYTRTEAERDFVKDALQDLEDAVGVPKKYLRKMSRIYHKQNLAEVKGEMEDLELLYENTVL